jgi:hypothetical protein
MLVFNVLCSEGKFILQVCVDMGPPILEVGKIPTTLAPSKDNAVVKVPLSVNGKIWNVTCVSMGKSSLYYNLG